MRISHQYKFIYLSNPKSGSESVRDMFDKYSDERFDKHTPIEGFLGKDIQGNQFDYIGPHAPLILVEDYFRFKSWDISEYFIFTTVRNPWSKLVSLFNYGKPDENFKYFWEDGYLGLKTKEFSKWVEVKGRFFYPLTYFISGENYERVFSISLDNLAQGIDFVAKEVGLEGAIQAVHKNRTQQVDYRKYFDARSENLVRESYEDEIAKFGFKF